MRARTSTTSCVSKSTSTRCSSARCVRSARTRVASRRACRSARFRLRTSANCSVECVSLSRLSCSFTACFLFLKNVLFRFVCISSSKLGESVAQCSPLSVNGRTAVDLDAAANSGAAPMTASTAIDVGGLLSSSSSLNVATSSSSTSSTQGPSMAIS